MARRKNIFAIDKIRGLYVITPEHMDGNRLELMVGEALVAGVRLIQYRRKSTAPKSQVVEARRFCRMAQAVGAIFIVNDDLELAMTVGADGVHWGRDDAAMEQLHEKIDLVKKKNGDQFIVGVSCYGDLSRAQIAVAAGADYIAFGSMFVSQTKPNAAGAGLQVIVDAKAMFNVPIVAIGGITRVNAKPIISAGANALAVITDVFPQDMGGDSITTRVKAFNRLFKKNN